MCLEEETCGHARGRNCQIQQLLFLFAGLACWIRAINNQDGSSFFFRFEYYLLVVNTHKAHTVIINRTAQQSIGMGMRLCLISLGWQRWEFMVSISSRNKLTKSNHIQSFAVNHQIWLWADSPEADNIIAANSAWLFDVSSIYLLKCCHVCSLWAFHLFFAFLLVFCALHFKMMINLTHR